MYFFIVMQVIPTPKGESLLALKGDRTLIYIYSLDLRAR